jgi:trans-2,3-dihydro-3-hydroxyanthranilate isomerase
VTSTSTAEHRLTLLDVFTDVPLTGNALAVLHRADDLDDATLLAFARETRLSETTFVQTASEPGADYRNRIWSMVGELPFAGHPSLGTAVAVARHDGVTGNARYVQQTGAGLQPIDVELTGESTANASMLQEPPVFGDELDPAPLLAAIGLPPSAADAKLPPQTVSTGLRHVMLPVADPDLLARVSPDPGAVDAALQSAGAWGLYVAACDPRAGTARVRMFGQSAQVLEDPATGSAAGPLCAYLNLRAGTSSVEITQGVEMGRPSRLSAVMHEDRVRVSGDVVVVLDGVVRF